MATAHQNLILDQEDLALVLQQSAAKTALLRIEVLNESQQIAGVIQGAVSGTLSISADSDVRRTASLVVQPTMAENIKLSEDSFLWLNKDIRIHIGLYNSKTKRYKYYRLGSYVYTDTSSTYDKTTNQLTINCADWMKKLDGTKNGQLGALKIKFPAYEENEETGEVIKRNTIRNAIIETVDTLGGIKRYRIDHVGEFYAMPENNADYLSYRKNNPTWNAIPADQEFSCGCSVLSILTAFRDLYPNYEMFFDMHDDCFVCQMVPSCYDDDLLLDNAFLQKVLISENTSVDMTQVRNICEVWGQTIDADFYSEDCKYTSNVYTATVKEYDDDYYTGDIIALKMPKTNLAEAKLNINGLGEIGIYTEGSETQIEAGRLKANSVYAFKIKKRRENGADVVRAYLLGQWQVHALNVLTNGKISKETVTFPNGKRFKKYSLDYFKNRYNCEQVELTTVINSPFTVQKIGEILDVKTGNEYENITSDDLARERARWENWKNCRLTDNITITTALLPFLDVNKKVSYRPSNSDKERQYIIRSINHDFTNYKTTITMYRFYPLYETLLKEAGAHKALSDYSHGVLSKYTHEELVKIISGDEL